MVKAGKASYIGASSMFAWQFAKALYTADLHGWTRFVSMQDHYNLLLPRGGAGDARAVRRSGHRGHPVEPAGARTADQGLGRRQRPEPDRIALIASLYAADDEQIVRRVADVAAARGVPSAQVALAWMLSKPVVTAPLVGATKIGHIDDAVAALDLALTDDEVASLEEPYSPRPIAGFQ